MPRVFWDKERNIAVRIRILGIESAWGTIPAWSLTVEPFLEVIILDRNHHCRYGFARGDRQR